MRGCFTTPTFTTFCGLACGFWAQPGLHTVTGMLCCARLEQAWYHARAHRLVSAARWSADQLGLVLLDLILAALVGAGAPVRLVGDDTLMRRVGRKIFGAQWHHDPLAPGRHRIAWANSWVVLGVLVDLPSCWRHPRVVDPLARKRPLDRRSEPPVARSRRPDHQGRRARVQVRTPPARGVRNEGRRFSAA